MSGLMQCRQRKEEMGNFTNDCELKDLPFSPPLHYVLSTPNTLQCIRGYSILYRLWSGVCLAGQRPPTREFVCKQLALECIIFINKSRSPEISVSMSSGRMLRIWCSLYYGDDAEIVANPIFGQVK